MFQFVDSKLLSIGFRAIYGIKEKPCFKNKVFGQQNILDAIRESTPAVSIAIESMAR